MTVNRCSKHTTMENRCNSLTELKFYVPHDITQIVSDIAIFALKRDVKLQLTN